MNYYKKGSASVVALVVVLLLIVGGVIAYTSNDGPKPGAVAGPESTNDYFCNAGVCTWYRTVACNTATSTIFVIPNPANATTTASIQIFTGTGNATSTTFSVGTTTKSSGLALSDISGSLINAGLVATSTRFTFVSGITTPLGSGQSTSGSGTITKVVVGPSEKIGAFGTSTYTGVEATNYTPSFTSCRAVVRFER